MQKKTTNQTGLFSAILASTIWGLAPLYWAMLGKVPSAEVLAHRVIWGLVLLVIVLLAQKKIKLFTVSFKEVVKSPALMFNLLISSFLVASNWFLNIWSVHNGFVVENSLGYYINPLITVLLGTLFLKEKINLIQIISIGLATIGVIISTVHYGTVPYVALLIAISFSLYGFSKKSLHMDAVVTQSFEMILMVPFSIIYLLVLNHAGVSSFNTSSISIPLLLIGSGVMSVLPLILHVMSLKHITLTLSGVIQYIIPTLTLGVGVFVLHEKFVMIQLISFIFIWVGIVLFSLSKIPFMQRLVEKKLGTSNPEKYQNNFEYED